MSRPPAGYAQAWPGLDAVQAADLAAGQLTGRGINWLTLRQRGKNQLARLAALPAPEWKTVTIARAGRHASHGWLPRAGVHAGCPFARVRIVVNSSASSSAYAWRCNSAGTYRSSGRSLNHL